MATATQTQELVDDFDEKVTQLKEAVQALTQASGTPPPTEPATVEKQPPTAGGVADPA
ncbi:MAG: hypothetical protein WBC78_22515 [Candidatus Sulfotelmatobacter sp.]